MAQKSIDKVSVKSFTYFCPYSRNLPSLSFSSYKTLESCPTQEFIGKYLFGQKSDI